MEIRRPTLAHPDHLRAKFPPSTPEDLATLAERKSKDLDAIRQLIVTLCTKESLKIAYDQALLAQKHSDDRMAKIEEAKRLSAALLVASVT